jgi:hypothetical protein
MAVPGRENVIKIKIMPKRTSINDVKQLETLNDLERIVKDKRNDKRTDAKKERRNRHYVKVLIKHQLKHISKDEENLNNQNS